MTIIEPKENKSTISLLLISLIFILLLVAYGNIFLYNQTVNLRHALSSGDEKLIQLKTDNADFKSRLYQLTSSESLNQLGEERGLVNERIPRYLEVNDLWPAVSVSQF